MTLFLSEEDLRGPECWICYDPDASDAGPMINPCDCKGDVGAVHHDCLRRWLVESADNPDALNCKVGNLMSAGEVARTCFSNVAVNDSMYCA